MEKYSEKKIFVPNLGKEVTLTIYDNALTAIEKNWESMYFSDKGEDLKFAEATTDEVSVSIYVAGDILLLKADGTYLRDYEDGGLIRAIIDSDALKDCQILRSNWFSIDNGGFLESELDIKPKTVEALENMLMWHLSENIRARGRKEILAPVAHQKGRKLMRKFVIRSNTYGFKITCPVCGKHHTSKIAKAIYMVGATDPICKECEDEYAPALRESIEEYYLIMST